MVRAEDRLDVLRVERLGARSEADEVGEEHRHDLALAARAHWTRSTGYPFASMRRHQRRAVLLVAHHQRQLDLALGHGHVHPLAVVLDREDIPHLLGDEREELDQLARPVREARAQDEIAAGEREPVPHDRDQQRRVDVPAGEDGDHRAAAAHAVGEQRRDRRRARALDHELRALEQEDDRLADLLVGHDDDVVEDLAQDRRGQLARMLDRDALRDREAADLTAGERRERRRLHADQARVRLHRPDRERDARGEPASADRDDHRLEVGNLLERARARSSPVRRSPARPRTRGGTSRPRTAAWSSAAASASSNVSPCSCVCAP